MQFHQPPAEDGRPRRPRAILPLMLAARLQRLVQRIRLWGLHPGSRVRRKGDPTHGVYSGSEGGLAVCTFAGERVKLPLDQIELVREGRAH